MSDLKSIKIITPSDFTMDSGFNVFLIDASTGNVTFTLSPILDDGQNFIVGRIDENMVATVSVNGGGSDLNGLGLFGQAGIAFSNGEIRHFISYSGEWYYY